MLLVGVVGVCVYWFALNKAEETSDGRELSPSVIQDRESLTKAIHALAMRRFGKPSRYWHHRHLFDSLHGPTEFQDRRIADLYARARYAPNDHEITREEFQKIQEWYQDVCLMGADVK